MPECGLSGEMFNVNLRGMCILLLMSGMFININYGMIVDGAIEVSISLLDFCLLILLITETDVLNFLNIIANYCISLNSIFCSYFLKLYSNIIIIKNVLLEHWSLYHKVILLFFPGKFPLKVSTLIVIQLH